MWVEWSRNEKWYRKRLAWANLFPYHFSFLVYSTHIYQPMKMEQTECSETSAYKLQTPGYYPKENIQHTKHGESLKSRICQNMYKWWKTILLGMFVTCALSWLYKRMLSKMPGMSNFKMFWTGLLVFNFSFGLLDLELRSTCADARRCLIFARHWWNNRPQNERKVQVHSEFFMPFFFNISFYFLTCSMHCM